MFISSSPVSGLKHEMHKICINKKGFSFHFDYVFRVCVCVFVNFYIITTTTSSSSTFSNIFFIQFNTIRSFSSTFFLIFFISIFMRNLYIEPIRVFYCVAYIRSMYSMGTRVCCEKCSSIYIQ